MSIKYEKVNEKLIRKAVEYPPHMRKAHQEWKRRGTTIHVFNKLANTRIHSEYVEFYIEEADERRRFTNAVPYSTIDFINNNYPILNIRPYQHGLMIHCRRDRWNECDKCGRILWYHGKVHIMRQYKINSYYNKSLCTNCWKKLPTIRKFEYNTAWTDLMNQVPGADKRYDRLEKKYGLKRDTKD